MELKKRLKTLNNDYVLNVVSKVATVLIGFITSMFSARYLGVVNKGAYNYICQVSRIGVIVGNLGIYQSYSYNYKKLGSQTLKKYSDICFLQFLVYLAVAAVAMVFSNDLKITLAVALIPFNMLKSQYENIMLIENMRARMLLHVIDKIMLTVCYAVLFFFAESNVIYIVVFTVFTDIFAVAFYLIKLGYCPKIWQVDFPFLKSVLKFGWLPMLSMMLVTVNYSVDVFFLEHMGTELDLGYYSLATSIINYIWLLPDAFKEVLFSKSAKKLDRKNISLSVQISLGSMLCCLIGFVFLGKPFIRILYGSEYLPSYSVVLILIIGAFSMSLFKLLGIVLVSQGKRKMHFFSLLVSAIINIIANTWSIPKWGMYGAAWSSVLSYTVCALVLVPYFCKAFDFSARELLFPSRENIASIKAMLQNKLKKG